MKTIREKIEEVLNNVEFLHGVPVSAPKETIDQIEKLIGEEREKAVKDAVIFFEHKGENTISVTFEGTKDKQVI